jgi:hypothetical protein
MHLAEFSSEEPSERAITAFLDDYEQELAYREASAREFGPVAAELRSQLERWAAGGAPAEAVHPAREKYATVIVRWRNDLERWVAIRGSGERLLAVAEFMTDEQWGRFNALQMREAGPGVADDQLDRDQAAIRSLLPRFEADASHGP